VADRLAVGDLLSAVEVEGAVFAAHQARPATGGARLLLAEGLSLLLQKGGEGALGESGRGCCGELFQGSEVGVESRSGLAEGPARDDFAPLGREITDSLEVLGRKLGAYHRLSYLGVAENGATACLSCYRAKWVSGAKRVLTSRERSGAGLLDSGVRNG
jgi:hypothetical protein